MSVNRSPFNQGKNTKTPIYLNVYDLHPINSYFYPIGLGAFHSGVEVNGDEYSFGGHEFSFSGVFVIEPKTAAGVVYRETLLLGHTSKTHSQIRNIVNEMMDEYTGQSYHPLQRNCNSFSNDFVNRLINTDIPNYINRLAYIGNMFSCFIPSSLGLNTPTGLITNKGNGGEEDEGDGSPLFPGQGYSLSNYSGTTNTNTSTSNVNNANINSGPMISSPLLLSSSSSSSLSSSSSSSSLSTSPNMSSSTPSISISSISDGSDTSLINEQQEKRNRMLAAAAKRMASSIDPNPTTSTTTTSTTTNQNNNNTNNSSITNSDTDNISTYNGDDNSDYEDIK